MLRLEQGKFLVCCVSCFPSGTRIYSALVCFQKGLDKKESVTAVIMESDLNLDTCTRLFLLVYNSVQPFSFLFPGGFQWIQDNSRLLKLFFHFSQNSFGFDLRGKKSVLEQGLSLVQEFGFNVCFKTWKPNQDSLLSTSKISRIQELLYKKLKRSSSLV